MSSASSGHWAQASSWNGRPAKKSRSDTQQNKCKQCRKWEDEGEWHGRHFYCSRCCAKYEQQDNGQEYFSDARVASDAFLQTYKPKWRDLIELEWQEELRVITERLSSWPLSKLVARGFCITDLDGRKHGTFFGKAKITFSKSFIGKHQFASGDEVIVSRGQPLDTKKSWKGEIVAMGHSHITIAAADAPWDLRNGKWRLDCGANKTAYERTKSALGFITGNKFKANDLRKLVLNEEHSQLNRQTFESERTSMDQGSLNASQVEAVRSVQNANLGLIQGPPGTGKTTTTCQMIRSMLSSRKQRDCQILVAADSNVAVDQLLAGLIKLGVKAVRVGFPSKVTEELRQHTLFTLSEAHEMNHWIEEARGKLSQVKDDLYAGRLKGKGKGLAHRDISMYVRDIQKYEQQMTDDILSSADVICSTLIGCGCDALLQFHFDTVIIDEASQATEPRCLVAFQKVTKQLILVGDQQQLPPVVLCPKAAQNGMQVSLFDRLLSSDSLFAHDVNMLKMQYRMHPLIRAWPSRQFYRDELLDGPSVLLREDNVHQKLADFMKRSSAVTCRAISPVLLIDTSDPRSGPAFLRDAALCLGRGRSVIRHVENKEQKYQEGSSYNLHEVEIVKACMDLLQASGAPCDIGVITPYTAQVSELKNALGARILAEEDATGSVNRVEVKTVDGYQGREKAIIIFSCVRTEGLGFLTDYRRLNVGVTRAKSLLVVIGSGKTLEKDPVWASYLKFILDEGLCYMTE